MTLYDHETGKCILNPYVTIYNENREWVSVNTSTLGEEYPFSLIKISDDEFLKRQDKLFKIVATVGKESSPYLGTVSVNGANDALGLVHLGYIKESYIKKNLPKSFEYLTRNK